MSALTAQWIAAVRARETARPDRLFDDPWAHELAGEHGYAVMAASEQGGPPNPYIPVRVRWFDDAITALAASGAAQVVLLGAGLDTRAFRLELPPGLHWYELDRPLPGKQAALAGETARCVRRSVSADLTEDEAWPVALREAGFDDSVITLWVAEGLLYYLSRATIVALLQRARRMCAPGSRLLADLMPASVMTRPAAPPFGDDDPAGLFGAGGWSVEGLSVPGAPDANFGRLRAMTAGWHPGLVHLVTAARAAAGGASGS